MDASFDFSNEVESTLARMPEEERLTFAQAAGHAVGMLGDYIAAAAAGAGARS